MSGYAATPGKQRGGIHSHDEREQTLNQVTKLARVLLCQLLVKVDSLAVLAQLLACMDGFVHSGDSPMVLVIGATNRLTVTATPHQLAL